MAANVRCAGGVTAGNHPQTGGLYRDEGCGWKGERFAIGKRIGISYLHWDDEDRKARTAKPCPRCGGRVELIPPAGSEAGS